MNSFWKQIIIQTVLRERKGNDIKVYSNFKLAKGLHNLKLSALRLLKDILLITTGIFSAAFGFKGFLLTNHFIDGGATGISLLISALTSIPLYLLIICVNIPFIILGYKIIGRAFAIKTMLAISGLALVVATVTFPDVT